MTYCYRWWKFCVPCTKSMTNGQKNGKQHEIRWVSLTNVLKNDQWCSWWMHMFYKAPPLIGCFTKDVCEDDEFISNIRMLKDLLECKTWKLKMPTTNDLFCANALVENFRHNVILIGTRKLLDYFLQIDELMYCKVSLGFMFGFTCYILNPMVH